MYWAKGCHHWGSGTRLFLEHTVPNTLLLVSLILTPALGCTPLDQHLQLLPNIPKLPKTQATCSGLSLCEPLGAAPHGSQLSTVGSQRCMATPPLDWRLHRWKLVSCHNHLLPELGLRWA